MVVSQDQLADMRAGGRLVVENSELCLKVDDVKPKRDELRNYPYWEGTGTVVTVTPFFGACGMASLSYYSLMGMTQVLMVRLDPGAFLEAVEEWGPMAITGANAEVKCPSLGDTAPAMGYGKYAAAGKPFLILSLI
jgi:hypothetical protein